MSDISLFNFSLIILLSSVISNISFNKFLLLFKYTYSINIAFLFKLIFCSLNFTEFSITNISDNLYFNKIVLKLFTNLSNFIFIFSSKLIQLTALIMVSSLFFLMNGQI